MNAAPTCPPLIPPGGTAGLSSLLRGTDCMTGLAAEQAFSRLFGSQGGLTEALTLALTIYVAVIALTMLTGRGFRLTSLSPRMIGLGMALTLATSWTAYGQAIWGLLTTGPDWLAGRMLGIEGSATLSLAGRLDSLFASLLDAAKAAQATQGDAKGLQPSDLLDASALVLMLSSVGVLVTSRIVLAALLALGPVFLIAALFGGTRGLFEGWVRAGITFALIPLFAVLLGGAAAAVLTPMVRAIGSGGVTMEEAAALLMAALVHAVLMLLAMKVTTMLASGWRMGRSTGLSPGWDDGPDRAALMASRVRGADIVGADLRHSSRDPSRSGAAGDGASQRRIGAMITAISAPVPATHQRSAAHPASSTASARPSLDLPRAQARSRRLAANVPAPRSAPSQGQIPS